MKGKISEHPVRETRTHSLHGIEEFAIGHDIYRGMDLYHMFKHFPASRLTMTHHSRVMPSVAVELGELVGLIYRSDKGKPGSPRNYIHFMENRPHLATNVEGTQLYIVGGSYRVTKKGIEG